MALAMSSAEIISGTITAPARLDKALAEATQLSRARVQALIAERRVEVDGAPATSPSSKVAEGAHFSITVPPAIEAEAKPQNIPLDIAFEDEHLIVVNKPAGMVVHPAAGNPDGTLVHFKGLSLHVVFMLIPMMHNVGRQTHGEILQKLADLVDADRLKPIVDEHKFGWTNVDAAYTRLTTGAAVGKVVLEL